MKSNLFGGKKPKEPTLKQKLAAAREGEVTIVADPERWPEGAP